MLISAQKEVREGSMEGDNEEEVGRLTFVSICVVRGSDLHVACLFRPTSHRQATALLSMRKVTD